MESEKKEMKIVYRPHLERRLKERKIPRSYPKKILQNSEQSYLDLLNGRYIAVKKLRYGGKMRNMVIAYDIISEDREIITIYPISDSEIDNKVESGRWKVYEKN